MKECKNCNEVKHLDLFYKQKDGIKGVRPLCKICHNKKYKQIFENYRTNNQEKIKKYRDENKEYQKIYNKEWTETNRNKVNLKNRKYGKKMNLLLNDNYIITGLKQNTNLTSKDIRKYPELIKTKRLIIKTKRLCKTSQI